MKELWIIGLGPGGGRDLTGRAREALEKADVIVGYTVYIDLIRAEFGHKEPSASAQAVTTARHSGRIRPQGAADHPHAQGAGAV